MSIVQIEQRTQAWFDWRNGLDLPDGKPRITGTMLPIIRGETDLKSKHRLWEELTGRRKPEDLSRSPDIRRGVEFEDRARFAYMQKTGISVEPVCVQHDLHPEFAVSLDGLALFDDLLVEIKCPRQKGHMIAVAGLVPDKYWAQVQWQLFCANLDLAHFWSYNVWTQTGALVEVRSDKQLWEEMKIQAWEFRECLILDKEPSGDAFIDEARMYRIAAAEFEDAKEALEQAKEALISVIPFGDTSAQGGGITASFSAGRDGGIDNAKLIKELLEKNVITQAQVDAYRKPPGQPSWRVLVKDSEDMPTARGVRQKKASTADAVAEEAWDF